ncbi:MAG: response regulator [Steroidobacteraceae bacterium]
MTVAMRSVLIVEDEPGIRAVLRAMLGAAGYRIIEAATAERALIEARSHRPDVVLIDLGLPDSDGLVAIRRIRDYSPVPIIVLSARTLEEQKIAALDAGADDYVTKPFASGELLARLRAAARRASHGVVALPVIHLGAVLVDLGRRRALDAAGADLHLTPLEFRLLESLARRAGMIVTREQLLREVWGPEKLDDTRGLRVVLKRLRDKLEPDPHRPRYLLTETGIGYRLALDD